MRCHLKAAPNHYGKAVDLWSIGILAFAMLTGQTDFEDYTLTYIPYQKVEKDLECLEVGKRPKDFIAHLLVVDESKRLTVGQALAHCWFTNKFWKSPMERQYREAIKDWDPPLRRSFNIEYISASIVTKLPPAIELSSNIDQETNAPFIKPAKKIYRPTSHSLRHFPAADSPIGTAQPVISTFFAQNTKTCKHLVSAFDIAKSAPKFSPPSELILDNLPISKLHNAESREAITKPTPFQNPLHRQFSLLSPGDRFHSIHSQEF
jgi:serine/threonine protein kinase